MRRIFMNLNRTFELLYELLGKGVLTPVQVWDDNYFSVKQVAARLGYSVRQVQRWMESGAISYIQIGSTRFFSEQYLIAFLRVN